MAKVKTYVRQKKMGRPITVEADKAIGIRLPVRLLDSVDEAAEGQGVNRSEMIRRLLDQALTAAPKRARGSAAK